MKRALLLGLLLLALPACRRQKYEYEHEIWLRVNGSGSVYVTGRPELWIAFKGLPAGSQPGPEDARGLFERSGLRVRRATLTRRGGRTYLFVSADFDDIGRLGGTPAFPDLRFSLRRDGERLALAGTWVRPPGLAQPVSLDREGWMAIRLHLPSKVYAHRNAVEGVERGNILAWRQEVAQALAGGPLELGARFDTRSILWSTVGLFAIAVLTGLAILAMLLALVARAGRRAKTPTAS